MYKVFNNDFLILINSEDIKYESIKTRIRVYSRDDLMKYLGEYFVESIEKDVLIYGYNTEDLFKDFKSFFYYLEAAGGLVRNDDKAVLFIKRFGIWDLPKGKIEKNETPEQAAIREVEEETSVTNLVITESLESTYHVYNHKNRLVLKKTFWFSMTSSFKGLLIPQTNESIEIAEWQTDKQSICSLKTSYRSLVDTFQDFFHFSN